MRAEMLRLLPELREPERPQRSRTSRTTRRFWAPRAMTPRSFKQCGSWFAAKMKTTCEPCSSIARTRGNSTASTKVCDRCRRVDLPLADGHCRGCRWHVAIHGPGDITRHGTQLWLGTPVPAPTSLRHSEVSPPPSRRSVSEHLMDPGQERRFELWRDWKSVVELERQDLPTPTDSAQLLLADLDSVMKREMWSKFPATKTRRTLTVLVSWLGADPPLLESDIRALVDNRPMQFSGRRVTQFLETRGLLIPDTEFSPRCTAEALGGPARRTACDDRTGTFGLDQGRARRGQVGAHRPQLLEHRPLLERPGPGPQGVLANGIESMREITQDDVKRAIAPARDAGPLDPHRPAERLAGPSVRRCGLPRSHFAGDDLDVDAQGRRRARRLGS